jgi:hypothetical protein
VSQCHGESWHMLRYRVGYRYLYHWSALF